MDAPSPTISQATMALGSGLEENSSAGTDVEFLREQHKETLTNLHSEILRLKRDNAALLFRMTLMNGDDEEGHFEDNLCLNGEQALMIGEVQRLRKNNKILTEKVFEVDSRNFGVEVELKRLKQDFSAAQARATDLCKVIREKEEYILNLEAQLGKLYSEHKGPSNLIGRRYRSLPKTPGPSEERNDVGGKSTPERIVQPSPPKVIHGSGKIALSSRPSSSPVRLKITKARVVVSKSTSDESTAECSSGELTSRRKLPLPPSKPGYTAQRDKCDYGAALRTAMDDRQSTLEVISKMLVQSESTTSSETSPSIPRSVLPPIRSADAVVFETKKEEHVVLLSKNKSTSTSSLLFNGTRNASPKPSSMVVDS